MRPTGPSSARRPGGRCPTAGACSPRRQRSRSPSLYVLTGGDHTRLSKDHANLPLQVGHRLCGLRFLQLRDRHLSDVGAVDVNEGNRCHSPTSGEARSPKPGVVQLAHPSVLSTARVMGLLRPVECPCLPIPLAHESLRWLLPGCSSRHARSSLVTFCCTWRARVDISSAGLASSTTSPVEASRGSVSEGRAHPSPRSTASTAKRSSAPASVTSCRSAPASRGKRSAIAPPSHDGDGAP